MMTEAPMSRVPLSSTWMPGCEPGLVFIHGLGAFRGCFRDALAHPRLAGRAMFMPDLVGFGDTPAPSDFSYTMEAQAEAVAAACEAVGLRRLAIVGHSMGGAVAILLAERWRGEVTHIACAVGNLVPADCFWSRGIVERGFFGDSEFEAFREGFRQPEGTVGNSSYYRSLLRTSASAMFASSRALVRLCDDGDLLGRFLALSARRLYLADAGTPMDPSLTSALRTANVPSVVIPHSQHGLMEDNPAAFYSALADFLEAPADGWWPGR